MRRFLVSMVLCYTTSLIGTTTDSSKVEPMLPDSVCLVDTDNSDSVNTKTVVTQPKEMYGKASYYGAHHHGRRTASGEIFNQWGLTAAHRSLPFGTKLLVTCITTGKSVVVTITDRGPFSKDKNRILDLSKGAALKIGITGVSKVKFVIIK